MYSESAHKAFTDWFQTPYIKSVVHGALDGASWLLIAVSLAAGALLSAPLALTVAVCAIIGGALNAGATEWQTAKGELEFAIAEKRREQWEFDNYEEGEIQEMVELYQSKGFSEHDAAAIIHTMARNGEFFVNHMMVEVLFLFNACPVVLSTHILSQKFLLIMICHSFARSSACCRQTLRCSRGAAVPRVPLRLRAPACCRRHRCG